MTKKNKNEVDKNGIGYEWEYANVVDNRTTWVKIKNFIYNPSTHAFLGRTAKSWGAILLFYAIFYSCLALLFAICMKVLLSSITREYPKWQQNESIIGTNPGLGFRPMASNTEAASLIWYAADNDTNVKLWTDSIDKFLESYKNTTSSNHIDCNYTHNPKPGQVCKFDLTELDECSPNVHYGYKSKQPCIFIKLNRIYGWTPDYFKSDTETPSDMPDDFIKNLKPGSPELNTVWVSCEGESIADKQNIGPLKYFPKHGFPGYYYPYEHDYGAGYLSPLVAVKFVSPRLNTLINVECRAWAKNIHYKKSAHQREGSVHFELQVDSISG